MGTAITSSVSTFTSETYHAAKEGGITAAIENIPNAIKKSAASGAIGFGCSLAGSYAGKALFSGIEEKGKTLQRIGKIGYKIGKRARENIINEGSKLINTARGLTSVVGTIGTAPMAALQANLLS